MKSDAVRKIGCRLSQLRIYVSVSIASIRSKTMLRVGSSLPHSASHRSTGDAWVSIGFSRVQAKSRTLISTTTWVTSLYPRPCIHSCEEPLSFSRFKRTWSD